MSKQNFDALGNEIKLTQNDFEFVQRDETIFDRKFETKPTTFIKDAFRRFCKNKSSVVGAIIIGIIISLSIIVPTFSGFDIETPRTGEELMEPKLFDAGFGFWDGTKKIEGVSCTYDETEQRYIPIGFEKASPSSISNFETYVVDGITYCNFIYDKYEDVYGEKEGTVVLKKIENYVAAGWCNFSYEKHDVNNDGKYKEADGDYTSFTFELTELGEEHCPVRSISYFNASKGTGTGVILQYLNRGYDKAPKFLFGTDNSCRDLFTQSLYGLRSSLVFALCISSICFVFGLIWGSISGYFGGSVDLIMERFCDILGGVPTVVIVTLFRLHLGNALWVFALSLCLTGWMGTAARTRTQFYRFKGREYVLASRTLGANDARLIFRHILPNSLGTIVTSTVLMIPGIIFTESSLSYLGLGLQGSNSFGDILASNQGYIQTQPMLILFPAFIISLLMISFNLFGNGLRDALNPSLKGSE